MTHVLPAFTALHQRRRPARAILSLLAVFATACADEGATACRPGAPIACTCEDGRTGIGSCGVDGCTCAPAEALSAQPEAVAFGEVSSGTAREAVVLLRNEGPVELRLRSADVVGDDPEPFRLPDGFPAAIPAGGTVPLTVRFTAGARGVSSTARLRVVPEDEGVSPVEVGLSGSVPGALLVCTPRELRFSSVWTGVPRTATIVCSNDGFAGEELDPRLVLDRLVVEGEGFSVRWRLWPEDRGLLPGDSAVAEVKFDPVRAGAHRGTLLVGGPRGEQVIVLDGDALETPPCDVELPGPVHHDVVEPGVPTTVELAIRNRRGDGPCIVTGLRLCEGTDAAYSLNGGRPHGPITIPGGGDYRFSLEFRAGYSSCHDPAAQGCLAFELWPSPDDGHRSIPLTCTAPEYPPSPVYPVELDFGEVAAGCAVSDRVVEVINSTSEPLHFEAVFLSEGITDEFFLRSFPGAGARIEPGASVPITVAYRPEDRGVDLGALFVSLRDQEEPLVVPLRGVGGGEVLLRDSYRQNDRAKLDLLFVIDNGFSMEGEAARLVPELGGLPSVLAGWDLDYRLAVTTTGMVPGAGSCPGGAAGGEDGRFFPVDGSRPRILDETTPDLAAAWAANLDVGTCHDQPAQPLEAVVRALASPLATAADDPRHDEANDGNLGFLRPDARLHVVAVSSRIEGSPGPLEDYFAGMMAVKGWRNTHLFRFDAITGDRESGCTAEDGRWAAAGDRLLGMVGRTMGGTFASICGEGWLDTLFGTYPAVGGPRTCFFLGDQPVDLDQDGIVSPLAGEVRVLVDGIEVAAEADGQPVWSYSTEQIAVCFAPGHLPGPGAVIDIEYYRPPCT